MTGTAEFHVPTQEERDTFALDRETEHNRRQFAHVAQMRQRVRQTMEWAKNYPMTLDVHEARRLAHLAMYRLNNVEYGTYRSYDGSERPKVGPYVSDAVREVFETEAPEATSYDRRIVSEWAMFLNVASRL